MQKHSSINIPAGVNFAPVRPFLDLKDPTIDDKHIIAHPIARQVKEKYDELVGRSREVRRSLIRAGQINGFFIQGEQVLELNEFTKLPRIVPARNNDPRHIKCINKMQSYATEWIDKWSSSNPDIIVSPYSNSDEAEAQARKANAVIDYLESGFYTKRFTQHEGLMAQIWGWYGRRIRPDYTAKAFAAFKEIYEDKPTPIGKGYGRCECGYRGEDVRVEGDANLCPNCGSASYEYDAPVVALIPQVVGKEKIFLPEMKLEELYFPSCIWDLSKTAQESDYFITERKIKESALRRIIKNIRFPEGESSNEFGLDAIETLAKRGAAINGRVETEGKGDSKEIVLTEMYLGADDLYDIRIGKGEKTVEGETLPKGKRMSDIYPEGCCFIGINGMALIIGIFGEYHKDIITGGTYHMKPMSGAGRGVDDATEIQKQFNIRYSQVNDGVGANATPATLYMEGAIEPKYRRMLGNPKAQIPVKMQNFDNVRSIGDIIAPLQGRGLPGDLINITFNNLESLLQRAYQITNFGGGNPRADNRTATGAEILDANSDAIFSPTLAIRADVNLDTAKKAFYGWCEITPFARFVPFKGKSKSGGYGTEISGEEVNTEYRWSYVAGSEQPKNRYTETQKKVGFFSMFGGVMGYLEAKRVAPKEVAEIARDFDVDFDTDTTDTIGENCRLRLERALKQLKQGQTDYLAVLAELEPSMLITEAGLAEKAAWFQSLLDTPEGAAMKREERELVSAFILAFRELSKGQSIAIQRDMAEVQMAAQAPMQEQQMAQQAAQGQAEQENAAMQAQQAQQQAEREEDMQIMGKAAETAEAEAQRQHEKETKAMEVAGQVAAAQAQAEGRNQNA